jgi:hypothetical protein
MSVCYCTDTPRIAPGCICGDAEEAVAAVLSVRRAFARDDWDGLLTDRNANLWLRTPNPRLGGTPGDLIRAGRAAAVVDEARRHCA